MLIPTAKNTRNITDFRKNPDSILESVQGKSDPLYLFRGSEPKAVVLDIEEYARLRGALEDYQDYLLIEDLMADPHRHEGGISLEDLIKKYDINTEDAESPLPAKGGKKIRQSSQARPGKNR